MDEITPLAAYVVNVEADDGSFKMELTLLAANPPDALRRAADEFQGNIGVNVSCATCGTRKPHTI